MDIKKYTGYFHDGSVDEIEHTNREMIFLMESAEMEEDDLVDDAVFSKDDRIVGKLHIEGIKSIFENGEPFYGVYKMKYENGSVVDFKIEENEVALAIAWRTFRPNPPVNDFSSLKIEAEKIWWENRPDLAIE